MVSNPPLLLSFMKLLFIGAFKKGVTLVPLDGKRRFGVVGWNAPAANGFV